MNKGTCREWGIFMDKKTDFTMYSDIQKRTNGDIFLGVVGPVRSGKSTFIRRFMDICMLPNIKEDYRKTIAVDELPQSAGGKTITTTEPKFIPQQAAEIVLEDHSKLRIKLIDCVGYMVEDALGYMENGQMRMVHTPWFEEEIPFPMAAEIGTEKVIEEHATIGLVIMTDGSFSDIPRESYEPALEKTVRKLKEIGKPFVVIYNTINPYSIEVKTAVKEYEEKYGISCVAFNIARMEKEDFHHLFACILDEFPISAIHIYTPGWFSQMPFEGALKQAIYSRIKEEMQHLNVMKDLKSQPFTFGEEYVEKVISEGVDRASGKVSLRLELNDSYYFQMLSELLGRDIESEFDLYQYLKHSCQMEKEYQKVKTAMDAVRQKGYAVVTPDKEDIVLEQPQLIHHGNKFGVKMKAQSPSIHMIKANVETEIAPIVGTKQQAEDLISYIGLSETETKQSDVWETNIFGKTVEQMVKEGIQSKISLIGDESQIKLQDTMQKIVNDTNGGLVCIII